MGERGDRKERGNREERWRGCGRRTGGRRIEIKGEGMKDGEAGGEENKGDDGAETYRWRERGSL